MDFRRRLFGNVPCTVFSESFSYVNGDISAFPSASNYGGTVKSTLVSSMTSTASGTGTYNYTYDVCGNITSITNSTTGESYSYTYDDQNQLTYESLNFGNLGANTRTVTYTYDNYGNLITKVTRETISSSKIIITTTKNYSFNNSTWKNLLTAYGSDIITYDNSGNPTSYRGDSMQWTNNQLIQQTHIVTPEDVLYINKSHTELIHLSGDGDLAVKKGKFLSEKGISLLRTAWGLVV